MHKTKLLTDAMLLILLSIFITYFNIQIDSSPTDFNFNLILFPCFIITILLFLKKNTYYLPALISIVLIILDFYYLTTNPLKATVSLSFFFGVVLKFYILFLLILNFLLVKKSKTIPFQNRKMLWLIWIGIILCFVIAKNWHTFEETCYQDHLHMHRIDTNVRTAERAVESLLSFTASDHVFQETIKQIIYDLGSMDHDIMRWGSSFTMGNTSIPPNIAVKLSSLYEDEVLQAEDIKFLEQLKQALHTFHSQTVDCDYQYGITIFHKNSQCTTPFIQHYREFLNDLSTLQ